MNSLLVIGGAAAAGVWWIARRRKESCDVSSRERALAALSEGGDSKCIGAAARAIVDALTRDDPTGASAPSAALVQAPAETQSAVAAASLGLTISPPAVTYREAVRALAMAIDAGLSYEAIGIARGIASSWGAA